MLHKKNKNGAKFQNPLWFVKVNVKLNWYNLVRLVLEKYIFMKCFLCNHHIPRGKLNCFDNKTIDLFVYGLFLNGSKWHCVLLVSHSAIKDNRQCII